MHPSARASIELRPSVAWNRNPAQYVSRVSYLDDARYVVGLLDQTTTSLTARLSYALSPDISLDVYAQPFISSGQYTAFKLVTNPHAARFEDRFGRLEPSAIDYDPDRTRYSVDMDRDGAPDFGFRDPDFAVRELRSNVVLRWEYRLGSTLYVVWTQARSDYLPLADAGTGEDLTRLLDAPSTNVFIIKLSYWLGV